MASSTWSGGYYLPGANRHAGAAVGLASTLIPTLLLATLCLLWRVSATWKSNARSLQLMFVGDFALAILATIYLALTLRATCRSELGTSNLLGSTRQQERTWFFTLNVLALILLSASRALAWVFGRLYVANTEFRSLFRVALIFLGLCVVWGAVGIAVLPSTCASGSAKFDFFSSECNHSVCPNCIVHVIGSLLDVAYLGWGVAFCWKYIQSSDGHFRALSSGAKQVHKEAQSAAYLQWQKRRSTAIQVFVPHALRLFAIIPVAFQFTAFTPSTTDTSSAQASFTAWQCFQVSWLCICTLLQPAMAAIYNLRSELVTAEILLSNSMSKSHNNRALGDADRHGTTKTHIMSTRTGKGGGARDSLDTESSTRDLTSGIVQERSFQVEEYSAGDWGVELQEIERRVWNGRASRNR